MSVIGMPCSWKVSQPRVGRQPDGGLGWKDSRGRQEMLVPVDLQASQDSVCSKSEGVTGGPLGHGRSLQHQFTQHTTAPSTREEGSNRTSGPEEGGRSEALVSGSRKSSSLGHPSTLRAPDVSLLLPSAR